MLSRATAEAEHLFLRRLLILEDVFILTAVTVLDIS